MSVDISLLGHMLTVGKYHSHYSLQYADGVAAPFLIHGPVSADYDVAFDPIIIADWIHDTSFNVFQQELNFQIPQTDTIVVDGLGRYPFHY